MKRIYLLLCPLFLFLSCSKGKNECTLPASQPLHLKYAQHFSAEATPDGYLLHTQGVSYRLIRKGTSPITTHADSIIYIPVDRIASLSGTHLEFLRELDALHTLSFTCDSDYIYSPIVKELIRKGDILPLGSSMQMDVERLLSHAPNVLFVSDESELAKVSNFPQIICQEWQEEDVLARAEWIKFFALFTDRLGLADSLFNQIESNYLHIKEQAKSVAEKPSVFAGGCWGDTWYLTGGKGYMAQLYRDAQSDFLLSDTAVGTVVCGLEWVLANMSEADVWLNCSAMRADELDARLSILKSVQKHQTYHFNKRSITNSRATISDFYESGVAHPDVLLADVVRTLHPSLFADSLIPQSTTYLDSVKYQ